MTKNVPDPHLVSSRVDGWRPEQTLGWLVFGPPLVRFRVDGQRGGGGGATLQNLGTQA